MQLAVRFLNWVLSLSALELTGGILIIIGFIVTLIAMLIVCMPAPDRTDSL